MTCYYLCHFAKVRAFVAHDSPKLSRLMNGEDILNGKFKCDKAGKGKGMSAISTRLAALSGEEFA